jgi:L-asparagine transporter-like permease
VPGLLLHADHISILIIGVSKPATEVVAAGVILQYWAPNLASWILALIFIVVLVLTNLLGVQIYGELEYWFALIKVITCILFIFVGRFGSLQSHLIFFFFLSQLFRNGKAF